MNNPPEVVCFNSQAFRYKAAPLTASVGDLFDAYEPEGNPANRMAMHQTIGVPPGARTLVELTFDAAGTYPFVSHRFSDAERGAVGLIAVS